MEGEPRPSGQSLMDAHAWRGRALRIAELTFWAKSRILVKEEKEVFSHGRFCRSPGCQQGRIDLVGVVHPSRDRHDRAIDQEHWVEESLNVLGTLFGGATAFPQGRGVWRDDAQGGKLLFDERSSSSVTRASKRSSGKRRSCGSSSTAWAERRSRERSGW